MLGYQKKDLRDFYKKENPALERDYWENLKSHCVETAGVLESHYKAQSIDDEMSRDNIAYYRALVRICDIKLSA